MPLVESARLAFPELNTLRAKPEAGPEGRTRNRLAFELRIVFGDAVGEVVGLLDGLTLNRRPGTELTRPRPRREVLVCLVIGYLRDRPFRPHLHLEGRPVKADCRDRPCPQLPSLSALEVRVKDESVFVDGFHEHHPNGWVPIHSNCSERHCVRLRKNRSIDCFRLREQTVEPA